MSIHVNKPYKIIERKFKRYADHYQIPADKCVIIPIKTFGDDISCDVRWEDSNGEMRQKELLFSHENIEPLNAMKDNDLHEIWQHYYNNDN